MLVWSTEINSKQIDNSIIAIAFISVHLPFMELKSKFDSCILKLHAVPSGSYILLYHFFIFRTKTR